MSQCPMFTPVMENMQNVETVGGSVVKPNCGNCGRWDKERQKCGEEEKLKRQT